MRREEYESIIEAINRMIDTLEYGDITKNQLVSGLECIKSDIESLKQTQ